MMIKDDKNEEDDKHNKKVYDNINKYKFVAHICDSRD